MTVSKILCLEIIKYAIRSKLSRFPAWLLLTRSKSRAKTRVSFTNLWQPFRKDDKRNLAQNKRKWHKFQKVYFYLHQCQRGGRLYWKIHMHRSLTQQYNSREKVRESQPISVSSKSSWDFFAREVFFLTSRDQLSAGESLFQLDLIPPVKLEDMRHFGRILWMTPR